MANIRSIVAGLAAVSLLALQACTSVGSVPSGAYSVGKSQVELGRAWSNVSSLVPGLAKEAKVLSVDGPLLNRLYVVSGLRKGTSLVRAPSKDRPMPLVRANMSSNERIEFVADTVAAMGYLRVETVRPRPGKMGVQDAVRFDLTARTPEGLDISGAAVVTEIEGNVFLILYLAPTEHYFQALLPEVERIMANAKIG